MDLETGPPLFTWEPPWTFAEFAHEWWPLFVAIALDVALVFLVAGLVVAGAGAGELRRWRRRRRPSLTNSGKSASGGRA